MNAPPSIEHIMGTDHMGRDLFSRILSGCKYSIAIALLTISLSIPAGATIGLYSGYVGGKIDRLFSIFFEALYAFPSLLLALLIALMMGPGILNTAMAISVGFVPRYFRLVRSVSFSVKGRPFVEAEISLGASSAHIVFKHLLRYALPSIITLSSINLGWAIVTLSSLGFLGLGIPAPAPEWGSMLGRGRDFLLSGVWWSTFFPGLMIVIAVAGFVLIAEGWKKVMSY
jgi:peptide/nickel transport system permease protein